VRAASRLVSTLVPGVKEKPATTRVSTRHA
jgi:hypothetical protein